MISKELLSEILGVDIKQLVKVRILDNELEYQDSFEVGTGVFSYINIYELAHRCKEWTHNNGYWMDSCFTGQVKLYHSGETYPFKTLHTETTEPQAIFKACEWILNKQRLKSE